MECDKALADIKTGLYLVQVGLVHMKAKLWCYFTTSCNMFAYLL